MICYCVCLHVFVCLFVFTFPFVTVLYLVINYSINIVVTSFVHFFFVVVLLLSAYQDAYEHHMQMGVYIMNMFGTTIVV